MSPGKSSKMRAIKKKAELCNLRDLTDFVANFAANSKMSDESVSDIQLAVEELLVNIIDYAFPNAEKGNIEIICSSMKKSLIIKIFDNGIPFNVNNAPNGDTGLSLDKREKGGMGIHIVRNLVDKIEYSGENGRNTLTLTKGLGQ